MQVNIKKTKNPRRKKKWTDDVNRLFFSQRRPTDGQQAHEKMLNIANYLRIAN